MPHDFFQEVQVRESVEFSSSGDDDDDDDDDDADDDGVCSSSEGPSEDGEDCGSDIFRTHGYFDASELKLITPDPFDEAAPQPAQSLQNYTQWPQ